LASSRSRTGCEQSEFGPNLDQSLIWTREIPLRTLRLRSPNYRQPSRSASAWCSSVRAPPDRRRGDAPRCAPGCQHRAGPWHGCRAGHGIGFGRSREDRRAERIPLRNLPGSRGRKIELLIVFRCFGHDIFQSVTGIEYIVDRCARLRVTPARVMGETMSMTNRLILKIETHLIGTLPAIAADLSGTHRETAVWRDVTGRERLAFGVHGD